MSAAFRCGHVAVVGRSNAGKSTLVNQLVGRKVAIVSAVPQTTRQAVIGVRNVPGAQVILVDTPGIHAPEHALNRRMLEETYGVLQGVGAIVVVVDAADRIGRGDQFALDRVRSAGAAYVVALNKVDLLGKRKAQLLPLMERLATTGRVLPGPDAGAPAAPATLPAAVVPVSALQGINVPSLLDEIVKLLPEGPATYPTDITTDQSERFLVAELIREKVLHATRAEVPHCTTVLVESLEEKERADGRRLLVVTATVAVEKESQKGILIGKGGGMLKRIGTEARRDIESMLEAACHLSLHVAVMPHWRDDRRVLGDVLAGGRGFSLPAGAAGQAAFRGDEDDAE